MTAARLPSAETHARAMLAEAYEPTGVEIWLTSHIRSLGGEVPLELIRRGDGERVLAAIAVLLDGAFA